MADKRVLLVEGRDDLHVFGNLLESHGLQGLIKIKGKEGVENLLGTLEAELLASDLEFLGVVVDADFNMMGRWQAIKSILQFMGYTNLPSAPEATGTVIREDDLPDVGVWLMPDNNTSGMLENFLQYLVPEDDKLWQMAEASVEQIPDSERRFNPHFIKAHVHTWLAWQADPGIPFGLAIKKRYFDPHAPHGQRLMQWVRDFYGI